MSSIGSFGGSGYWYPTAAGDVTGVDVLNLLRRYRATDTEMRRRTRDAMGMGENDLLAVRFLLKASRTGTTVTPRALSQYLGISSASTTILIDRLERSGHVQRRPHPTDRRSIHITATSESDAEVRATLGAMHQRMIDTVDSMSPEELRGVAVFLSGMIEAAEIPGEPADETAEAVSTSATSVEIPLREASA